jgi:hypothetical protein
MSPSLSGKMSKFVILAFYDDQVQNFVRISNLSLPCLSGKWFLSYLGSPEG